MHVHILHSGLVQNDDSYKLDEFDAGRYSFKVVQKGRWDRDSELLWFDTHHGDEHSPDLLIAHSSVFQFDILRMLRFILDTRNRAPWIVFVLLINKEEENELAKLPIQLREHFSKYFQSIREQFSILDINEYIMMNINVIENLYLEKRKQHFGAEIVSRKDVDRKVALKHEQSYDFALSFSGAQRAQARDLANALKARGCKVFFDEFETSNIVGKNLTEELYDIYNGETNYCVIFVSDAYRKGAWTNQERRAALDKAIKKTNSEYILPIKIEDVELPGISSSVSYLKWDDNVTRLANILYEKLIIDLLSKK